MITSDRQYQTARGKLKMLEASGNAPSKSGVANAIANAAKSQINELAEELRIEISEYEKIRDMQPDEVPIQSIDDLMVAPIRYRIASNMSAEAFARMVGVSVRQILRYESQGYQNSSVPNLRKILARLNIRLHGKVESG